MKTCLAIIVLVLIGVCNEVYAQGPSTGGVFQSWNELQVIVPLIRTKGTDGKKVDRLFATFSGTMRFGRRPVEDVDDRAGAMFEVRIRKYLYLVSGVTVRRDEIVNNVPRSETRLDLGATFVKSLDGFNVKDRNLFERRFRSGRSNTSFYRNRLQVAHPVRREGKVLFTPFISNEVYYDLTEGRWAQNEFFAGVSRALSRKVSLDIAYLRNNTKPVNANGIGLALRIDFR